MKQILIISGKGGTGKTVVTASFAVLAKNKVMVDADVDAANLYLLLDPEIKSTNAYIGSKSAFIDEEKCIGCGKCEQICRFDAISPVRDKTPKVSDSCLEQPISNGVYYIDKFACEGCGACRVVCPKDAVTLNEEETGKWFVSDTKYGPFVHAKLGIAQENSGKLVSVIREKAKVLAIEKNADYIIIDGPPGIGCPVIASLNGIDMAIVVTEPSLSGIHDMQRVIGVAQHFGVDTKVIINKYDINLENTNAIKEICKDNKVEVLGQLPFSDKVPQAIVKGVPIIEFCNDQIAQDIINVWEQIK
ncbi:MAG: ATP-binding protein [Candidatus Omnitrophica bacterium]|nr:ATP-binding protein [Candidatus Omnitrophota bacterium]MBU1047289.1 ATP-binding protein [Candidatus Omnitrophota bacterium]MBU1630212.1 ATP-binding protein [Candidatus Omnitrophota bacterium]MBU1767181.1 ATP-binding protein [Candidatus Omnitrophota bacterium]MBU1889126.1 ATP-binding protein [Candidatus Omnitrophota bacterium]